MIKFEHTVFALPFALSSMVVAADGFPDLSIIGWVLAAMVGARSAAMAFNRVVDVKIDEINPRTKERAIPKGLVSITFAAVFTLISSSLLVFAAYKLNTLAFYLSPVALAVVLLYSYSKRFTSFSHLWLGLSLAIAPVGAWIAVKGSFDFPPMVLSASVICWAAGFDILYSLQDVNFDKENKLFSIPAKFGIKNALLFSRFLHVLMPIFLVWFGYLCGMGAVYYIGTALVCGCLVYEQSLVSQTNISRINTAFFILNGVVSIVFFLFVLVDILF